MRTPRRVPWSSLAELEQVCNWIYYDERDIDAKVSAVNRLAAWRAITPLPHALEATLSLLIAIIQDQESSSKHPYSFAVSTLAIRQIYASALVRLINGLVDPLQQGAYARSIASIATRIGLPQWLVELRHAATHEELPSLELLRSGAGESLAWLLNNYFLPTLACPSNVDSTTTSDNTLTLSRHLKRYKSTMKTLTRDASLVKQYRDDIAQIFQSIESWIADVRLAASSEVYQGWGTESSVSKRDEEMREDWREQWALEKLCDLLLARWGLVPISSRKRVVSLKCISLPAELVEIWKGLLENLRTGHPLFPTILLGRILEMLLYRAESNISQNGTSANRSREVCLAGWAAWIVDEWGDDPNQRPNQRIDIPRLSLDGDVDNSRLHPICRHDAVVSLATALGASEDGLERTGALLLLEHLVSGDPELLKVYYLLRPVSQAWRSQHEISDAENVLSTMEARLSEVLQMSEVFTESTSVPSVLPEEGEGINGTALPNGWNRSAPHSWKACPIGVFVL